MLIHTGDKPLICPSVLKGFFLSKRYLNHVKHYIVVSVTCGFKQIITTKVRRIARNTIINIKKDKYKDSMLHWHADMFLNMKILRNRITYIFFISDNIIII